MRKSKIYAFGSNGKGQLGVGHREDISNPEQSLFLLKDRPKGESNQDDLEGSISKIVAGGNHTLVLMCDGKVFVAGEVHLDQILRDKERENGHENVFYELDSNALLEQNKEISMRVTDVAATWEACFLVIENRWVYVCGIGNKGELGLGKDISQVDRWEKVMDMLTLAKSEDVKIVEIAASMSHVVILCTNGNMYGWGGSRKGQLGEVLRKENIIWQPTLVSVPFQVIKGLTGREFTFLVGHNEQQLLLGDNRYIPESIQIYDPASSALSCGWSNIYALSRGHVQGFGRHDSGQIPPQDLPSVRLLAAGSEHCVAFTISNDLVAWGWGEHGNCGFPTNKRGNVADRWNTIPIHLSPGETIAGVAAGCSTTFAIVTKD